MASTYELIEKYVLGSDAATIDLPSSGTLTQAYEHLQLSITGRSTYTGGVSDDFRITFNPSPGTPGTWDQQAIACKYQTEEVIEIFSAYDAYWIQRFAATNAAVVGQQRGACFITISDYANTSKRASIQTMGGNVEAAQHTQSKQISWGGASWSETTAITEIRIRSGSASMKGGSTVALYGMKSS